MAPSLGSAEATGSAGASATSRSPAFHDADLKRYHCRDHLHARCAAVARLQRRCSGPECTFLSVPSTWQGPTAHPPRSVRRNARTAQAPRSPPMPTASAAPDAPRHNPSKRWRADSSSLKETDPIGSRSISERFTGREKRLARCQTIFALKSDVIAGSTARCSGVFAQKKGVGAGHRCRVSSPPRVGDARLYEGDVRRRRGGAGAFGAEPCYSAARTSSSASFISFSPLSSLATARPATVHITRASTPTRMARASARSRVSKPSVNVS
jgi:hypothetical protein